MGPHHLERIEALGGAGKSHLLTAYASAWKEHAAGERPDRRRAWTSIALPRTNWTVPSRQTIDRLMAERGSAGEPRDTPPGAARAARPSGGALALSRDPERRAARARTSRSPTKLLDVAPASLDRVLASLARASRRRQRDHPAQEPRSPRSAHRLLPMAERIGAVNTFWTEHGAPRGRQYGRGWIRRRRARPARHASARRRGRRDRGGRGRSRDDRGNRTMGCLPRSAVQSDGLPRARVGGPIRRHRHRRTLGPGRRRRRSARRERHTGGNAR